MQLPAASLAIETAQSSFQLFMTPSLAHFDGAIKFSSAKGLEGLEINLKPQDIFWSSQWVTA